MIVGGDQRTHTCLSIFSQVIHHSWQTEGRKHPWKVSKFHSYHFNLARVMEPILETFCSLKRVFEHDSKYVQCNISEKKNLEILHNTVALSPMVGAPGRGHAGPCLPAPAWVTGHASLLFMVPSSITHSHTSGLSFFFYHIFSLFFYALLLIRN